MQYYTFYLKKVFSQKIFCWFCSLSCRKVPDPLHCNFLTICEVLCCYRERSRSPVRSNDRGPQRYQTTDSGIYSRLGPKFWSAEANFFRFLAIILHCYKLYTTNTKVIIYNESESLCLIIFNEVSQLPKIFLNVTFLYRHDISRSCIIGHLVVGWSENKKISKCYVRIKCFFLFGKNITRIW